MNPADLDYENEMRDLARALFGKPAADDPDTPEGVEEPPNGGNVVPSEGKTAPTPPRDQMRDLTRDLFGFTD